ncbi:MAG: response regulator transcription factor [bacterium]|nr:response regulator transcription factor [bacterium]
MKHEDRQSAEARGRSGPRVEPAREAGFAGRVATRPESSARIRVVLADRHELMMAGVDALTEQETDIDIVATCRSGAEAIEAARTTRPSVVVLGLSFPGMSGLETARRILEELPSVGILFLSNRAERHCVEDALEAGASGYVVKDCSAAELLLAIRSVAADQAYLSPRTLGHVLHVYRNGKHERSADPQSVLTPREREIVRAIAGGESTKEIAARLEVSVKTVSTHRERIMRKLDIRTVAGLTKFAIREGLTSLDA